MSERPAITEIVPRLPVTLKLAALTFFFTIVMPLRQQEKKIIQSTTMRT